MTGHSLPTVPEDLLDELYAAPTDFQKWNAFLVKAAETFCAPMANIAYGDFIDRELSFSLNYGFDPIIMEKYAEHLGDDPRLPVGLKYPGRPFSDSTYFQYISEDEWLQSGMYREVFRPVGGAFQMSVTLPEGETRATGFGFMRRDGQDPFNDEDLTRFGELLPHVKRALKLYRNFARLEESRLSALSILDDLPIGVVICDIQARVLFANSTAKDIASVRDGLVMRHGELWANNTALSSEFRGQIRKAVEATARGGQGDTQTMRLERREASQPLLARIVPIRRDGATFQAQISGRPVCAVYVTDPERPQETRAELLQRMFGLTRKESEILKNLVLGLTVTETAKELNITTGTLRSYLKAIFGKTDTSSQSELIKLVVTSPTWEGHLGKIA